MNVHESCVPVSSCLSLHLITLVPLPLILPWTRSSMLNNWHCLPHAACVAVGIKWLRCCYFSFVAAWIDLLWSFGTICSKSLCDVKDASSNSKGHSEVLTQGPGLHQLWRKDKKKYTAQKHGFNNNMKEPMWWEAATFFTLLSLKPTLMLLNPTPLSSSWSGFLHKLSSFVAFRGG